MQQARQNRPWSCPYCKEYGPWVRKGSMERHIYIKHTELRAIYDTGVTEALREQNAILNPIHFPDRSVHLRRRELGPGLSTTQEAYYFQGKATFATRSKDHNKSQASIDDVTGKMETYLPHHIKSKTLKIVLGPQRERLDRLFEEFDGIWKGDQLEDVPTESRPFNYNLRHFNP